MDGRRPVVSRFKQEIERKRRLKQGIPELENPNPIVEIKTEKKEITEMKREMDDSTDSQNPSILTTGRLAEALNSEFVKLSTLSTREKKPRQTENEGVYLVTDENEKPIAVLKREMDDSTDSQNPSILTTGRLAQARNSDFVKLSTLSTSGKKPRETENEGVYLVTDENEKPIAVLKIRPHGLMDKDEFNKEVAAYILDHRGFCGVPPTVLFTSKNWYGGEDKSVTGSLQQFVPNKGTLLDFEDRKFISSEDIMKLSILDVRYTNTDRHYGNILVKDDGTLVPIDHGRCFQKVLNIACDWKQLPQAKAVYSKDCLDYINEMDAREDVKIIKDELGWDMPTDVVRVLELSTSCLKRGAAKGLGPAALERLLRNLTREIFNLRITTGSDPDMEAVGQAMDDLIFVEQKEAARRASQKQEAEKKKKKKKKKEKEKILDFESDSDSDDDEEEDYDDDEEGGSEIVMELGGIVEKYQ